VSFTDLKTHIRHLAEKLRDKDSIEIKVEDIGVEFSLIKNTYKVKATTLSLLIRTSDVGRDKLYELHSWLLTKAYNIKVRKSPKKKYINQIKVVWDTSSGRYPTDIASGLNEICFKLGSVWSSYLSIGYFAYKMNHQNLPGKLEVDTYLWKAGYAIGWIVGKIMRKI
jgi:hypothetical protein